MAGRYLTRLYSQRLSQKRVAMGDLTEIIPFKLYLGSSRSAFDLHTLQRLGITHILNTAKEVACYFPEAFEYYHLAQADGEPNIQQHFQTACDFINNGEKVLVHCQHGISRSATLVVAYLMQHHKRSLQDALLQVKGLRPCVSPHFNLEVALMTFESELGKVNNASHSSARSHRRTATYH